MVRDIHHVPGRLRVSLTSLKRNGPAAEPLRTELLSIDGVQSVSVSSMTGSVIVRYKRDCFEADMVWTTLQRLGHLHAAPVDSLDPAKQPDDRSHFSELGQVVANAAVKAAVGAVVEHCVGRSAGALIGLLL